MEPYEFKELKREEHGEHDAEDAARRNHIETIVDVCLGLDREWARDICSRDWGESSVLNPCAHAAARAISYAAIEPIAGRWFESTKDAADAACGAVVDTIRAAKDALGAAQAAREAAFAAKVLDAEQAARGAAACARTAARCVAEAGQAAAATYAPAFAREVIFEASNSAAAAAYAAACAAAYATFARQQGSYDFEQVEVDAALGYAVSCVARDQDVAFFVYKGLTLVDSNDAFTMVLASILDLRNDAVLDLKNEDAVVEWKHDDDVMVLDGDSEVVGSWYEDNAWGRGQHGDDIVGLSSDSEVVEPGGNSAVAASGHGNDAVEWKYDDGISEPEGGNEVMEPEHEGDPWGRKQLLMMWCRAAVCGLGMALPVLWGAVVPWAWVLTGVCVSGLLGGKAGLSQLSAGKAAWMLLGWALIGLGTGYGLSWGVLSVVASHGAALAIGMGATALCVGGLGNAWSQAAVLLDKRRGRPGSQA